MYRSLLTVAQAFVSALIANGRATIKKTLDRDSKPEKQETKNEKQNQTPKRKHTRYLYYSKSRNKTKQYIKNSTNPEQRKRQTTKHVILPWKACHTKLTTSPEVLRIQPREGEVSPRGQTRRCRGGGVQEGLKRSQVCLEPPAPKPLRLT